MAPPGSPSRPPSGLCGPRLSQPCPGPSGLCGNFNGLEGDDFRTAGGLVEATGAGFANTWKAQSSCDDKLDWLEDPCALSIESGEAWPPGPGPRQTGFLGGRGGWVRCGRLAACCLLPCGWLTVAHGGSWPRDPAEGLLIRGWWPRLDTLTPTGRLPRLGSWREARGTCPEGGGLFWSTEGQCLLQPG